MQHHLAAHAGKGQVHDVRRGLFGIGAVDDHVRHDGANSLNTIQTLAKGADVKTGDALSIRGGKVDSSENDVREWVKALGDSK